MRESYTYSDLENVFEIGQQFGHHWARNYSASTDAPEQLRDSAGIRMILILAAEHFEAVAPNWDQANHDWMIAIDNFSSKLFDWAKSMPESFSLPNHTKDRYEVQHHTFVDGWINTTTNELNEPVTYELEEDANLEIKDYMADVTEQIHNGERRPEEGYDPSEFRVRKVPTVWDEHARALAVTSITESIWS